MKNQIDLSVIEQLVKESFGEKATTKYCLHQMHTGHLDTYTPCKDQRLEIITINPQKSVGRFVGKFLEQDGSSIELFPKYTSEAVKYSEMFERIFGKKPQLKFSKKISMPPYLISEEVSG